jgi:hypothetical protein
LRFDQQAIATFVRHQPIALAHRQDDQSVLKALPRGRVKAGLREILRDSRTGGFDWLAGQRHFPNGAPKRGVFNAPMGRSLIIILTGWPAKGLAIPGSGDGDMRRVCGGDFLE